MNSTRRLFVSDFVKSGLAALKRIRGAFPNISQGPWNKPVSLLSGARSLKSNLQQNLPEFSLIRKVDNPFMGQSSGAFSPIGFSPKRPVPTAFVARNGPRDNPWFTYMHEAGHGLDFANKGALTMSIANREYLSPGQRLKAIVHPYDTRTILSRELAANQYARQYIPKSLIPGYNQFADEGYRSYKLNQPLAETMLAINTRPNVNLITRLSHLNQNNPEMMSSVSKSVRRNFQKTNPQFNDAFRRIQTENQDLLSKSSAARLFVADMIVKSASATAALSGMLGPLGTYAYGKTVSPEDEEARYAMMGRSALGGSLGGMAGTALGIPAAMATGLPIIPGMLLSSGLGMLGSGVGSYIGAKRYLNRKKKPKPKRKETHGKDAS